MVRALSITMLMEMLSAVLASISPDHFSNWYPVEGTAVNTTTVPLGYVPAVHGLSLCIVTVPPCSGALTTVSFLSPQAQILAGVATDITNAAHTTTMATSQNSWNPLLNFTSLFTSRDNIPLSTYILASPTVNTVIKANLTIVCPTRKVIQSLQASHHSNYREDRKENSNVFQKNLRFIL